MINRRLVRETVLQSLYAHQLSGDSVQYVTDNIIKEALGTEKEARRFAEKLFFNTLEHNEELDEIISSHIQNWNINRLALIDRLVLKMALAEFLHFDEIPTKVTINEAIEICKKFSTAQSGRFVNGILDASLIQLENDNKIQKKGRGLIDQTINK